MLKWTLRFSHAHFLRMSLLWTRILHHFSSFADTQWIITSSSLMIWYHIIHVSFRKLVAQLLRFLLLMRTWWCSSGLILIDVNKLINNAMSSLLIGFHKLFKFKLTCLFSTRLTIIKVLFDHLILNFCILLLSSIAFTSVHLLTVLVLF